jgi:hypothetical protein
MLALGLAWLVVLAGSLAYALARGGPTAREQTSIQDALPVVDHTLALVATDATADGMAVVYAGGYERLTCRVTSARPGVRFKRAVTAVVTPGTEQALLQRVAARLPSSFHASTRGGTSPRLFADAGFYVLLTGTVNAPGQVRFVADTGDCRPGSNVEAVDTGVARDEAPVTAALARLGLEAQQWQAYSVGCPGGTSFATTEARTGEVTLKSPLDETLRGTPDAVVASPELYAYRNGADGVTVRTENGQVVVTATTHCP